MNILLSISELYLDGLVYGGQEKKYFLIHKHQQKK